MVNRLILLLFVTAACSPKALTYLNEEGVRFQDLQTYRLVNTKLERTNLSKEGREIIDVLEATIRLQMKERGYEESNLGPDLILRYDIATNQRTESRSNYSPYGPPVTSRTFMESVIIIDLVDTRRDKMFWQASYDLTQQSKQLKQEQATEDAISEIFYSFPYRATTMEPDPQLADWKAGRKKIKTRRKAEKKAAKRESKAKINAE
jgi:hypothetical protein